VTTQFTSCAQNVHHRAKRTLASDIFPKQLGIFRPNFTHILNVHIKRMYARMQIFIELSPTVTKLCHIQCDHPACVSADDRHFEYIMVVALNHRLNSSSSPVLTATCLSYGRLCDFLGFFPEPIWRSHSSTDFDAKWLKRRGFTQGRASWSKNRNFLKPLTPRPQKPPKFAQFWSGQNFRSISRLTLEVSRVNTS